MNPDSPAVPGLPFGSPPERRSVAGPSRGTARQKAALSPSPAARAALRRQVDKVRQRRRPNALRPGIPSGEIDFEIIERGEAEPLLVVNELLMLAADIDGRYQAFRRGDAADLLTEFGLEATAVTDLDGRVVRLQRPHDPLPVDTLRQIAARMRALGCPASLTTITPLGPILKGENAPAPADGLEFPRTVSTSQPVAVAVIDSGITKEPRDDGWLSGLVNATNVDPLNVFPLGAPDIYLDFGAGHGTFVAGIIQQVAPSADIRVYRAVDSDGIGSEVTVATAMLKAAGDGAKILNLSLGSETEDDQPPPALRIALDLLAERHPDVLVVAAAGNSDSTDPCWPAAFRDVVSVGALDVDRQRAPFSNHGHWVDCATIGCGVLSTYVPGEEKPDPDVPGEEKPDPDVPVDKADTFGENPWATWSGTSFAAPQIAGAVARLMQDDPSLTPRAALRALLAKGVPVPGLGMALEILPGS